MNPQVYWFSKKIDLKAWFEWSATDQFKQKKEFFNLFSKIYEKMWIQLSWQNFESDYRILIAERRNNREKFDLNFKKLLFTWGSFQIETFFNIINEKPKEDKKQLN